MIPRNVTPIIKNRLKEFPILTLTGPRHSGKTTLLRNEFPDFKYFNLERIDYRQMIMDDPMGFLQTQGTKVIFDEAQRIPELFSYIQVISDEKKVPGQYILSGSQSFLMHEQISQSLAGRTYVSHLLPFGINELPISGANYLDAIFKGFYPRLHDSNISPTDFYPSYIQTYIERDLRSIKTIENLDIFTRFIGLCAGRIGQVLNLTSLANDTGISVNTAKSWLSLLESSFILYQLKPWYKNFNKRLIKSPKLYFYDTGLACSLLKITNVSMVQTHYLYGALYENFVISEIRKAYYHAGIIPSIYYWRESNGTEIDCIIEKSSNSIMALEIKGGATFNKDYLKNLNRLPSSKVEIEKYVIHPGDYSTKIKDVKIVSKSDLGQFLNDVKDFGY